MLRTRSSSASTTSVRTRRMPMLLHVVADPRACPAIELPLNAQAVAGDSLPITVTLNTDLVTVNTPVTGLGLLKSYLNIMAADNICARGFALF